MASTSDSSLNGMDEEKETARIFRRQIVLFICLFVSMTFCSTREFESQAKHNYECSNDTVQLLNTSASKQWHRHRHTHTRTQFQLKWTVVKIRFTDGRLIVAHRYRKNSRKKIDEYVIRYMLFGESKRFFLCLPRSLTLYRCRFAIWMTTDHVFIFQNHALLSLLCFAWKTHVPTHTRAHTCISNHIPSKFEYIGRIYWWWWRWWRISNKNVE